MDYNYSLKKPVLYSLLFFVLAALLGLSMRLAFVIEMPEWFMYKHVQHAHSHTAMLGWLFAGFYLGIVHFFGFEFKKFASLFWMLQGAVLGMLLTFPIMGYAALSLVFSTLHIILTYFFIYKIWKELKTCNRSNLAKLFLKASLIFLFLSTLGTWAIGPVVATGMKGSALYYGAIQFYLHFQFNGWFIFAALAIFFSLLDNVGIHINPIQGRRFFYLLVIATILTFALAISWSTPHIAIFLINSLGVLVQLFALFVFIKLIYLQRSQIKKHLNSFTFNVLTISLVAFILKIIIQAVVVLPQMAEVSYTIRNFVIGFIHLLMLGCLSLFLFGIFNRVLPRRMSVSGTWIFIAGVIISEALLFIQGLMLWQEMGFMNHYYLFIAVGSGVMVVGIMVIVWTVGRGTVGRV